MIDAENYLLNCQRYIELNPVRANMVESPIDYKWSSYKANGKALYSKLWTPHSVDLALGKTLEECSVSYQKIFRGHIDIILLKQIRDSVNRGLALGSERFKQEIEQLTGRRVVALKPGPKLKV